jgi:Flp pilus assembly protein TadD
MPNIVRIFLVYAFLIIVLFAWSAIAPSHINWGMHFMAFYSLPVQIGFFALFLLLLLPPVTAKIITFFDTAVQRLSKIPLKILIFLSVLLLIGVWLSYPSKLHLLGDGAILLRSIPGEEALGRFPVGFRNQPLVWFLYRGGEALLSLVTTPTPVSVYNLIDIISGAAFVGLIFWWLGKVERPKVEKTLLGLLVLFCGGFQFFFGYVENYVTQYVFTAAFAITGWLALEKKIHVLIPLCIYVVLVGLHIGSLIFAPALAYLFIQRMNGHKMRAAIIIAAAGVAGVILLSAAGFNIKLLIEHFLNGSPDFLPLLSVQSGYFPYPMFSLLHLADWLNLQVLIVPLGLAVPVLILVFYRREVEWKNPALIFLVITVVCGFAFTWIINSALGVARDWDLFSSFLMPLIILNAYFLQLPFKMDGRKAIIVIFAGITLLHTVSFIGINGIEEKHLARAEMLDNTRLLSITSRMFYYESLANYLYDHGGYDKAREYYEQYAQYDSVNPRILANLADSYRKLQQADPYFRVLQRAAAIGSSNPGVYSNLGVEYANRGDTAKAIEMNLKCLAMDSTQVQAHANLAILYLNVGNSQAALRYATSALALGMRDPVLYRIQAKAYIRMNDYQKAVEVYDRYLALMPGDKTIREQRDRLNAMILLDKRNKPE